MPVSEYLETPPSSGPGRQLRRYVVCRWTQRIAPGTLRYVHRIIPDGCLDLIWLDGSLHVAGPDTGPVLATLEPGSVVTGVRFQPGQAPAVLGVAASELRDRRVRLADIWGDAATRRLTDRLHDAADPGAAAIVLEREVADRLAARDPRPDPVIGGLVTTLRAGSPLRVSEFADQAGVSERQLHRRCVDAVGYSPKVLDRVLRLQRFLAAARTAGTRTPDRLGLAALAGLAGYADQAHLSRECRRLTGSTPRELVGPPG